MKGFTFMLSFALLLTACTKEKEEAPHHSLPTGVEGQWLRGSFDLSTFWNYTGTAIQAPATTDGLHFKVDGTVELYTVFFPTESHQGCTPQKLVYKKGVARFDQNTQAFTLEFTEGEYREFYQGCAGKVNLAKPLTAEELKQLKVSGYWKVVNNGSETAFGIAYASVNGPYLYLKKSSW